MAQTKAFSTAPINPDFHPRLKLAGDIDKAYVNQYPHQAVLAWLLKGQFWSWHWVYGCCDGMQPSEASWSWSHYCDITIHIMKIINLILLPR